MLFAYFAVLLRLLSRPCREFCAVGLTELFQEMRAIGGYQVEHKRLGFRKPSGLYRVSASSAKRVNRAIHPDARREGRQSRPIAGCRRHSNFLVLLAIGTMFMIFSTTDRQHIPRCSRGPGICLLLFVLQETGGIVLMVSAMFLSCGLGSGAQRRGRHGLMVGLVILGRNNRLSLYTSDIRASLPGLVRGCRSPASPAALFSFAATVQDALESRDVFLKNSGSGEGEYMPKEAKALASSWGSVVGEHLSFRADTAPGCLKQRTFIGPAYGALIVQALGGLTPS